MATGIDSYYNTYTNPYSYGSYTSSSNSVFDIGQAQQTAKAQADALLKAYEGKNSTTSSLTTDTADFLDRYTLSLKTLGQSADALRSGNLDKLLYDKSGSITDDTVKNTVSAMQSFVDDYNSSLKLMNDNADRGPGVTRQLERMVNDPTGADKMKLVGVTVNKDGTLNLDADKMTEALKTTNTDNLKLYKDIIGGQNGITDNVLKDVQRGLNTSAQSLIQNDLAEIQEQQAASNPYRDMFSSLKGGVHLLNNQAAVGMMMNMLV